MTISVSNQPDKTRIEPKPVSLLKLKRWLLGLLCDWRQR